MRSAEQRHACRVGLAAALGVAVLAAPALADDETFAIGYPPADGSVMAGGGPVVDVAIADLDGDGAEDVVVTTFSGGAHCCFDALILPGAGHRFRRDDAVHTVVHGGHSPVRVEDVDADGRPEIVVHDWVFAYWRTTFSNSPAPTVYLEWDGADVTLDREALDRRLPLDPLLGLISTGLYHRMAEDLGDGLEAALARVMLELIYRGRGDEAVSFARGAWGGDPETLEDFLADFAEQLAGSAYASDLFAFNGWADAAAMLEEAEPGR
ncbi:MAG: VCBS repeat-containing protein [Azospirillaceae bacterium]